MPHESGDSATLLWFAISWCVLVVGRRGTPPMVTRAEWGRTLARVTGHWRWPLAIAWAAGVALVVTGAVVDVISGRWWWAVLLTVMAISWGWALVENVRRRDDPVGAHRPWSPAYGRTLVSGLSSWMLLILTWVVEDLVDGSWTDAIPGAIAVCLVAVALTVEVARARRAAQAVVDIPPPRRDAGQAQLTLRRPSNRWAFGVTLSVYADSHLVAELRAGETRSLSVPAGEHDMAFVADGMDAGTHRVDVPSGTTVEVELVLDENAVTGARMRPEALTVELTDARGDVHQPGD